jgi:F420-dependent oxidoreductase-like protein
MDLRIFTEPQQGATYDDLVAVARHAEEDGFDAFFRSDHYLAMGTDGLPGPTDAWLTLAGLARDTSTIRLGTLVTSATFRLPGPLAISVAQVDQMSGGRVELGIGAGWFESEHTAYGFKFGTTKERLDELDRQLEELTRQWTDAPDIWPKPVQKPHPPIIVGGTAKPRTVRAAVQWADEYNTVFATVDEARERKRLLDEAAREAGREPLRFSLMTGCVVARDEEELAERLKQFRGISNQDAPPISGTADEVVEQLRAYEAVGVERVMLQHLVHEDVEMVSVLGEVAARLG